MPAYQGQDGWNYVIFDGFQGGLQTTVEPNKIPDNASPNLFNIFFDGGNSFEPRKGTSAVGETSANYGPVMSMFNFKHANGTEYMMRTTSSAVEYYVSASNSWSTLLNGFTTGKKWGFATVAYDDAVYFGNGTDPSQKWTATSAREVSAVSRGNIFLTHNSRLIVGGLSAFPNTIYCSRAGDPTDFSGSISATAAFAHVQRFGAEGDRITSLRNWTDKILVGKPDTLWTFEFKLDNGGNSGAGAETPIALPLITSESVGPTTPDSTIGVDDIMSWITSTKKIKNLSQASIEDRLSINNLSDSIEPTLNSLNFASAAAVYFDRKMFIACRSNDASVNDVVLVYDFKYKAWTKIQGWSVNCWVIWNDNLYYGDSVVSKTVRVVTGRNDQGSNIQTKWLSKEIDFGFPQIKKEQYELYAEGYISENTTITFKLYRNGDTSTAVYTKTLTGTDPSVDTTTSIAFGEKIFGELPYGGSQGTSTTGNKFRTKFEIPMEDFHSLQVEVTSDGDGQVFRITHLGFWIRLEDTRVFNVTAFK
jgi:hypothetical protein